MTKDVAGSDNALVYSAQCNTMKCDEVQILDTALMSRSAAAQLQLDRSQM